MTDTPESPAPAPPEPAPAVEITPEEVASGKVFAILCYALGFLGIPFFILPLVMRDNDFSLYHAKQVLILWLLGIAGYILGVLLLVVCIGPFIMLGVGILSLVLAIMGLINAINGQAKPLPLIGKYAEQWFAGVTKVAK
ncbi:MAG: DUF4870 domain-containing protein [Phycisphaerales bacterium]|nr:DUF4870 domain-containing protein [Phycisphaerales bacterium]